MNIKLDYNVAKGFKSEAQRMRVITETWVERNLFCPICGNMHLDHYVANKPVADFYCNACGHDFELKSKNQSALGDIINDGAYETMIARLNEMKNPDFLFMTHLEEYIKNIILIPNYFFTPSIIIKRKPLAKTARRAGWIGCNINIGDIPQNGKIFIVKDGIVADRNKIIDDYARTKVLFTKDLTSRGWMLDVLSCVDRIGSYEFTLHEVYRYEEELKYKHKTNNNIQAKIRQQLQILRDKGLIEFVSRGQYRKLY